MNAACWQRSSHVAELFREARFRQHPSGLLQVSHRGGGTVWLYEGGKRLRAATRQERQTLPVMSVWGQRVVVLLAERHLLRREP
jgi:hypothetical protein